MDQKSQNHILLLFGIVDGNKLDSVNLKSE